MLFGGFLFVETGTVTGYVIDATTGTYTYYVHNFAGSPSITSSSATVRLYNANGLYRTYTVPTVGTGTYWHVFDIVDGTIVTRNVIQSSAP